MITRLLHGALFLLIAGTILFRENTPRAESASDLVESFQAVLLRTMKTANHKTVRQRYDELVPAISDHFHVPLMTQIVTGRHWGKAQPSEKAATIAAFKRINVATLATLFDGYSGETFLVKGERAGPSKTTIVSTHLVNTDKSTVKLSYVAGKFNSEWRLIDVVVDGGISELKVRRSEYHLILSKSGLSGLIRLLNDKADDLMSK